ncbi:MAG: divergent polysaccharide deacetylase family protein [Paracoccaceae bacterium]
MSRGFLLGLFWGAVASALGLAAISLWAPGPAEPVLSVPAAPVAAEGAAQPPAAQPAPQPAPAPALAAPSPPLVPPSVAPAEPRELAMADVASPDPAAPAPETAPALQHLAPAAPEPSPVDAAPRPSEGTMPAPRQDLLLDPPPSPPPPPTVETRPLAPAAEPAPPLTASAEPMPAAAAPAPAPAPQTVVPQAPAAAPPPVRSRPGLGPSRLPGLGPLTPPAAEAGAPAPAPPIIAHARPFAPDPGRPLFAVILQDIGAAGMPREDLTRLPFAVTFAVDPYAPDAAEAARAYRDAGQEVVTLSAPLPPGATAADLEQIFQALTFGLPESVALLDPPSGGLQEDRPLATLAIPILKAQGRGIIVHDRGLGAAGQVAAREGLAQAGIFRILDAAGESPEAIRRTLDRAAFRAAQEGRAVVLGQTRAETVAVLLEWLVEGRAAAVQLAPITAVMQTR